MCSDCFREKHTAKIPKDYLIGEQFNFMLLGLVEKKPVPRMGIDGRWWIPKNTPDFKVEKKLAVTSEKGLDRG